MEMGRFCWCIIIILVWVQACMIPGCSGCLDEEENALLLLINYPKESFSPSSNIITNKEITPDCCNWTGVQCSNITGRVTYIYLYSLIYSYSRDTWSTSRGSEYWYLNTSLFLPFQELKSLYLYGYRYNFRVSKEGLERLSGLSKLEELYLYSIPFNDSLFPSLAKIATLKILSLQFIREWDNYEAAYNNSQGFERLSGLSKLEELYLDYNDFNESILPSLGKIASLKKLSLRWNKISGRVPINKGFKMSKLEELNLDGNNITDMRFICKIASLKKLSLRSFGYLNGVINIQGLERLSGLSKLEELYLGDIPFNDSLLPSLAKIATLKILYLHGLREWDNYEAAYNNTQGFERLSGLSKLEELYLDDNAFNESILPSLGKIASLKILSLWGNKISGRVPINKGFTMSKLEELNLGRNNFSDMRFICKIPSLKKLYLREAKLDGGINIQELGKLKNLQELYLDYSSIDKSFLHKVGVMSSLNALSMSTCGLNGSLPNQGWCELKNLQELDLGYNHLEGRLPSCLANMTTLRVLGLAFNNFNGSISMSSLQSLEYLFLSYNKLVDEIESQSWTSYFQLKVLLLSSSLARRPTRTIPKFLHYQYKLQAIDLSHNNLVGKFPTWLLENNTRLEIINLRNNSFTNPFQVPSRPNPHIRRIDISNNDLGGPIPTNLGFVFPNLENLNMSQNAFVGIIPTSLGNLVSLRTLDLSSNHLSGTIPDHLGMGCLNLRYLKLSNNKLSGQLFPAINNLKSLNFLYLDHNHFSGKIPYCLSNSSASLIAFDFSSNSLSGMLPRWIGNMTKLVQIVLAKNQLEGPIPIELCKVKQIRFLDLSKNNLSDFIPSCFNSLNIKHVHLGKNRLSGPITSAFKNSSALVTLDLRDNRITGNIPDWIGNLSSLSVLLLKANYLQGRIPIQICLLGNLTMLDLSNNTFTGPIPHCLSNISFGATDQKTSLVGGTYGFSGGLTDWKTKTQAFFGNIDDDNFPDVDAQQEVEFTTKRRTDSYKGDILNYMSGIDLSCNCLSGEIPLELGNLSNIRALNLSHNNLTGSIPTTFSELEVIESLDLSHNKLNGSIPPQLIELNFLAVFSVADNNLSGRTPERKGQFGTFDESSYKGNPLLYGPPLPNSRIKTGLPSNDKGEECGGFIDMDFFRISFGVSYTIVLLAIVVVLYINPYWRQVWFSFIEVRITKSFYFFNCEIL